MYFRLCILFAAVSIATCYDSWVCPQAQQNVSSAVAPYFAIRLLGPNNSVITSYTPGISQTVELYSTVSGANISEIIAAVFSGNTTTCPSSCSETIGSISLIPGVSPMSKCKNGITQTSVQNTSSVKFRWTAPVSQTGPVSVWTVVICSGNTYEAISATFTGLYVVSPSSAAASINISSVSQISANISASPSSLPTSLPTISSTKSSTGSPTSPPTVSSTSLPTISSTSLPTISTTPSRNLTTNTTLPAIQNSSYTADPLANTVLTITGISIAGVGGIIGFVFIVYHLKKKKPIVKINSPLMYASNV